MESLWQIIVKIKAYKFASKQVEIIGEIKHWWIQLFRLFGGEKFGEWPNKDKWLSKIP